MHGLDVHLSIEPYILELRTPFGTSHSASTTRTNALITLTVTAPAATADGAVRTLVANGEVGLPPKKRGCYEGARCCSSIF